MRAGLVALGVVVVAGLAGSGPVQGQSADEARRKLEQNKQALAETQRRKQDIQTDVKSIAEAYDVLRQQSVEKARSIKVSEGNLTGIEARLSELKAQESLVRGSLVRSHGSISVLLAALQRMGRNPPPVMITRREDALAMVRSAMVLAATFPELRTQAAALSSRLAELTRILDDTQSEGEKYKSEVARYRDEQLQLTALMEKQRVALSERQTELKQIAKTVADKTRDVADVSELIGKIEKTIAEQTRLGAYEKQLAAAKNDTEPEAPKADAGKAGVTATDVASAAVQPKVASAPLLRPSITLAPGDRLAMVSPGRIEPALPFQQARGQLPMPAQGRTLIKFGDKTQTGPSQGIVIETRYSAQITSPNDGWVLYAGEFRSYGKILIINGGGGYHILLAGLTLIDVQVGQFVLAGEPVGTMSSQPKGAKPDDSQKPPVLYVEFRKDQKPINPDPWWVESARKVQG